MPTLAQTETETATETETPPPKPSKTPWWAWVAGAVGLLVLLIIVFLMLFQWNWLRAPLARAISAKIHRPVTITGDLEVHPWSWTPRATIHGLVIGNPSWAGAEPLATMPKLTIEAKLMPLLGGRLDMPLVEVDRPDIALVMGPSGVGNWVFNPGHATALPAIGHLIITDGALRYHDPRRRLVFAGAVSSNEGASGAAKGVFALTGGGSLNGAPFTVAVTGGALIHVDRARPYPFHAVVASGPTHLDLAGSVTRPFDFGVLSGRFTASGPDLADLYHLTGLALPSTPPYRLTAGFGRVNAVFALRGLQGRLGDSDIAGGLSVDDTSGRPFLKAALTSRRLRIVDLGAIVGAVPKHLAGHTVSPAQIAMAAKLKAEHRLLPDAHLAVDRIRGMDAKVTYRAESVEAGHMPIRGLRLDMSLDHGIITVDPLDVTLPQGRLEGVIRVDGSHAVPAEAIDLRLTNGRLESLMGAGKPNPPLEGGLYARVKLSGTGDSVRSSAAGADGAVTLVIPQGEMRQAFAELLGLDASKALLLLIGKNQGETPIRCAVADFHASHGVLTAQSIVLDTGVVVVGGSGRINLRDETLDLRLRGKPKKFRLIRLNTPITLKGSFASPKMGIDVAKAAPQVLLSIAVGVFAAPVAAILPFVNPGLAKDANCAGLVAAATRRGAPPRRR